MVYRVYIRVILGLYRDTGKGNGNYYIIMKFTQRDQLL